MKFAFGLAAVFAVAVTGTLIYNKTGTTPSKTPSETIQINNHTVSGNITEDLKGKDESAFSSEKKAILKLNVDKSRVVYFTDQFSQQSVASAVKQLKELEAKSSERITLAINSPGGSVVDGAELISQMEQSKAPVDTVCIKLCASMAAMTHSYGAKRYALDRAILMYHPTTAGVQGQVPNMMSLLKTLTRYIDKMNANIVKRSKLPKEEFDRLVAYELWIDSEDALNKGLIDGIVSLNIPHEDPSELPASEEEFEYEEDMEVGPRVEFTSISPYAKDLW